MHAEGSLCHLNPVLHTGLMSHVPPIPPPPARLPTHQVDVGSNMLGVTAGTPLLSAVRDSPALMALDVRGCGLGADEAGAIQEELLTRAERRR